MGCYALPLLPPFRRLHKYHRECPYSQHPRASAHKARRVQGIQGFNTTTNALVAVEQRDATIRDRLVGCFCAGPSASPGGPHNIVTAEHCSTSSSHLHRGRPSAGPSASLGCPHNTATIGCCAIAMSLLHCGRLLCRAKASPRGSRKPENYGPLTI